MSVLPYACEFNVVGLDRESSFRNKVHMDCIEPICKVLSARLHVFVLKVRCILVGVIEVIGCRLDCNDDVEWIGQATFKGCDGKEGDRNFDHGLGVGLGRPICFSCCRSVRIGLFRLVGADVGAAGAGQPPQIGGLLVFAPPIDWELIELFGVVAMPNFLVGGIFTSMAVVATSMLMTMREALGPLPMRPPMLTVEMVQVPPNFLQLWTKFTQRWLLATTTMLSGSSVRALILSFFYLSLLRALTKAPRFLFAASCAFAVLRCDCQLLWRIIVRARFTFLQSISLPAMQFDAIRWES